MDEEKCSLLASGRINLSISFGPTAEPFKVLKRHSMSAMSPSLSSGPDQQAADQALDEMSPEKIGKEMFGYERTRLDQLANFGITFIPAIFSLPLVIWLLQSIGLVTLERKHDDMTAASYIASILSVSCITINVVGALIERSKKKRVNAIEEERISLSTRIAIDPSNNSINEMAGGVVASCSKRNELNVKREAHRVSIDLEDDAKGLIISNNQLPSVIN